MYQSGLFFGLICVALLFSHVSFAQQDRKESDGTNISATQQGDNQETREPRTSPQSVKLTNGQVTWPMRMAKNRPVPVIEAKVNGQGPFLFYLDTGASTTTLNKAFVKKINLKTAGKTTIRGPGNGPGVEADIVTIDQLQIGNVDIRNFEAAAFDRAKFSGGEDLVGSIGLPVFGDLLLTLDYPNDQIILDNEGLGDLDGKTILACDYDGPVPFFDVQLDGVTLSAAFDSGFAGLVLVGEETAKKLKFASEPKSLGKGRSVSGEIEIKGAPVNGTLKVGKHVTTKPMLVIMPEVLTDREVCVLGHAWARGMSVTYDMKHKKVRFQKSGKQFASESETNDDSDELKSFVGKYGPRAIFQEDGKLRYRREGGPALELKRRDGDTFSLVLPAGARSAMKLPDVRFERDENNHIKGFSLVRDNEVEEFVEKDGGSKHSHRC